MRRPTLASFKAKALQNDEVKKEYERLKPLFELKKKLVEARLAKGITQEELAKRIGTSKANISRLESLNNTYMPNFKTLMKYTEAIGAKISIEIH